MSFRRPRPSTAALTLAGILIAGLLLRLWGIRHGLPVVYNLDEYAHFVVTSVKMFGGGYNPHYFQNPPAYTYLLHVLFAFAYGGVIPTAAGTAVKEAFNGDPTTLYTIARVTSALLGVAAAGVLYVVGKRLYGTLVGLLAAAFMAFTFLPVHYSHLALNDVPTLLPLCIGLLGLAGITLRGNLIDYLIAGLGLGLATATKYTAAALAVSIFIAWLIRVAGNRAALRRELPYLIGSGAVALAAFVVANPFAVIDAKEFLSGVRRQQRLSAGVSKLGTDDTTGWQYYLWTLTWGFGWIPTALAAAGAWLALRRDWRKALPFVAFAILVWLFMGKQERFYARWLMPVYPVLAMFAAYAIVRAIRATPPRWRMAAGAVLVIAAFAQPLITVIHNDRVLTRDDTRDQAKAWLIDNAGPGSKVAFELIGPPQYFRKDGVRDGEEIFKLYPLPRGSKVERYAQDLSPARLKIYADQGYCYIVTGSIQKGRAIKSPEKVPGAVAYYKELDRTADHLRTFSPMKAGKDVPRFNFDMSYNWYSLDYVRPGPKIDIHRLKTGRCTE
ncbi:MAG TPA: glycosyltransferase family 39 protein [Solirubrobacterales bacterium]|nr:glycosyltransferase family 39 protein [Solirubrobacterales bacterium]